MASRPYIDSISRRYHRRRRLPYACECTCCSIGGTLAVSLPRAPAYPYHDTVMTAFHLSPGFRFRMKARACDVLRTVRFIAKRALEEDYQREAVEAWRAAGRRGLVLLLVREIFCCGIVHSQCRSISVGCCTTVDLVGQWYDGLRRAFGEPVGILGGHHEVHDITVSTYDSAWIHMERYGNRFGLVVFDEVHHLPGPSFSAAAMACIAPFRLGLTATLERPDGGHLKLDDVVGPVVYQEEITDLAGEFLADYRTKYSPYIFR